MKLTLFSLLAVSLSLYSCGSSGDSSSSSSPTASDSDSISAKEVKAKSNVATDQDSLITDLYEEYPEMEGDAPDQPGDYAELTEEEYEEFMHYLKNLEREQQYSSSENRNNNHEENTLPPFIDDIKINSNHNIETHSGLGASFPIQFNAKNLANRKLTVKLKLKSIGHGIYNSAEFTQEEYVKTFICDSKKCRLSTQFIVPYSTILKKEYDTDPNWIADIDVDFTFMDENGNEIPTNITPHTSFTTRK